MTDPRVGTVLAGHRVLSVIGRGGMSVVYLAEHIGLHRTVALKVLSADLAEDETFRERFIRESRMAAALDHPNIVTVYDAGEADGLLYISMRNVEGTDLEHLLKEETRLDPGRATAIVAQAAAALDAAHEAGLVHRDVKPGNILLAARTGGIGRPRVPVRFRRHEARRDPRWPDEDRAVRRHGRLRGTRADPRRRRRPTSRRLLPRVRAVPLPRRRGAVPS